MGTRSVGHKNSAPQPSAQAGDARASEDISAPTPPPPPPPLQNQKNGAAAEPEEFVAIGPQNASHFRARRLTGESKPVLVRHRNPDLFPTNFKFKAAPSKAYPGLWEPVKTPRWRGSW